MKGEPALVRAALFLSSGDVRAILEAANRFGVLSLSFRGLDVTFQPKVGQTQSLDPGEPSAVVPSEGEMGRVRRRLRELDGSVAVPAGRIGSQFAEVVEDEIEMLKVTDPVAYESMMTDSPEYTDAQPV